MITLTHFTGLKIRIRASAIIALIPDAILRKDSPMPIDSQTKCAVVLVGAAYHVKETVAHVEKLMDGQP